MSPGQQFMPAITLLPIHDLDMDNRRLPTQFRRNPGEILFCPITAQHVCEPGTILARELIQNGGMEYARNTTGRNFRKRLRQECEAITAQQPDRMPTLEFDGRGKNAGTVDVFRPNQRVQPKPLVIDAEVDDVEIDSNL